MVIRPKFITIISLFIIVVNMFVLITAISMNIGSDSKELLLGVINLNLSIYLMFTYGLLLLNIIVGIGIFIRKNWARYFYLISGIINYFFSLIILHQRDGMLIGIILFIVINCYLFSSKADQYFMDS